MTELLRRDEDDVAVLTLNRPDQLNALSPELFLALDAAVEDIAASETIGCVVIKGAGRGFCAGYDLKSRERARAVLPPGFGAELLKRIAALPQPVIAATHGICFTGGLELALVCDFIIAAESTRFSDTHAKWGMRAAWGLTQRLPRRIGAALGQGHDVRTEPRAGRPGEELVLPEGLAQRCVPDKALEAAAMDCARAILGRSGSAIRWIKDQVDQGLDLPLPAALEREKTHRPTGVAETDARLKQAGWAKT